MGKRKTDSTPVYVDFDVLRTDDINELYAYLVGLSKGCQIQISRADRTEGLMLNTPMLDFYLMQQQKQYKEMLGKQEELIKAKDAEIRLLRDENLKDEKSAKGCKTLLNTQKRKIEQLERDITLKDEKISNITDAIDKLRIEYRDAEDSYMAYIAELETKLDMSTQPTPSPILGRGKATEMPLRVIREVVRLYCLGSPVSLICRETGASRGQITRVISGGFTNTSSKAKVLKAINQLLRVNQNEQMLEKLKALKIKYE